VRPLDSGGAARSTRRVWLAAAGAAGAAALGAGCAMPGAGFTDEALRHAQRLRDQALGDGDAWRLVRELCGGIGARPAGSAADAKAAAWAVGSLQQLGLAQARAETLPLRIWQRGPAAARLLAPEPRPIVMAALGNTVAAPADGIEAELAYYPDLAALRADTSGRASGRIVFIDQKTERTRDGRGYGLAVPARLNGAVEAARRGALALAIRSIGTSGAPVAHTGAMRYDLSVPRIPAFAVSVPDAERIAALAAAGQAMRMHFTLEARAGVEASTANVIAEVPGTDLAHEIVLISAHLDSWDAGQGALDNGAGVAIVSAAAGLIARGGQRPRRTVRLVLFGNEENGFDGALAYGDRYKDATHQLVGESDFGAGRVYALASRVQPAAIDAIDAMARVLAPLGVTRRAEGANQGSPGPDAALLMRRHRWPGIQLAQDGSAYFDVHHTAYDTLERIDPATLPQNVACWAVVAWLAAMAPLPFGPPTL
jgi:carboxypeptidase Q